MELLGHITTLYLTLWELNTPFYLPTILPQNSGPVFQFLHVAGSTHFPLFDRSGPGGCDAMLTAVLLGISLMGHDVHLLTCFLTIHVVPLEKGLCKCLTIFELSYLSFCHWVAVVLYIFSMLKPHKICDLRICLPILGLVSWLSRQCLLMHKNSQISVKPIFSNYFFNDMFRKYLIQHHQGLHLCFKKFAFSFCIFIFGSFWVNCGGAQIHFSHMDIQLSWGHSLKSLFFPY